MRPLQPKIWRRSENQALRSFTVCTGTQGPMLGHQNNLPRTALACLSVSGVRISWLVKWLALLSQALDATHSEWGNSFVPDFILPCIPNLESYMPQPFTPDVLFARTGLPSLGHTVAVEIGRRSAGYSVRHLRSPFTALNAPYSVPLRSNACKASRTPPPFVRAAIQQG